MTSIAKKPFILVVDDQPEEIRGVSATGFKELVRHEVVHPRDVEIKHLEAADLVLVDYRLDDWTERANTALAMQPSSGLALAVLLREHADRTQQGRLTAFCLHSAHLGDIEARLPVTNRQHVLARLNNLEWAFAKSDGTRWGQMVALANGVRDLPRAWPDGDSKSETQALTLLALDDKLKWFERARRTVLECQPPIHELRGGAHGLLFVRWLLHQILPYPTFLWREEWVAARLQMSTKSLQEILKEGGQLAKDLEVRSYKGALCDFMGLRWWRAGLEDYVWEITNGQPVDVKTLHEALKQRTAVQFEPLPTGASFVSLGKDFTPTGEFISAEKAVRLSPDQWPPFADDAWASIKSAKEDPFLASIVDPRDSVRLDTQGDQKE